VANGRDTAEIGVFGGSGFYSLLEDVREVKVDTPYGPPSDSFFLAEVGDRRVAFLPRHGRRHTIPPHKINYRANVWAMRSLGVKAVISPCAAGSLQLAVKPGDFVVCDQLVDRTNGRVDTFYDGRNGFQFTTTAAGGLRDGTVVDEAFQADWNLVYQSKVSIDDEGWNAEYAIPFKTLRYLPRREQVWHIQLRRVLRSGGRNEMSYITPMKAVFFRRSFFFSGRTSMIHEITRIKHEQKHQPQPSNPRPLLAWAPLLRLPGFCPTPLVPGPPG